jgi:xanthine dehydrogenase FAD-binding subunit
MRDFEYAAPGTLKEAVGLLAAHNGAARPLAGGTDLIDHVRMERLTPDLLVDIKKIPELNVLECDDRGLRLGAAVSCHRVISHEGVQQHYGALFDACSIIGGVQIQSRASVGGNLCNSGAAADSTPALIALNAVCRIAGPDGERSVPVHEFCTGPGRNVLQRGELLVELQIPAPQERSGSHYRRFIPRNEMDIAVVGVGASVALDETSETVRSARIGLGAVAPVPLLASSAAEMIVGNPLSDEVLARAADECRSLITPIDDMRGTIDFRRHVTGVLVERVLRQAVALAKG